MVRWLSSKIETIAGAAVILAGASFASKLLGLIRNRVLAAQFGAGDTLDAYYAAFRIPDALFQFIVLGALSAGFIPVFVELMEGRRDTDEHWRVAASLLNALLILLALLSALFIIFAPQLQSLIAPGFSGEKLGLTIKLARIMALGPIFLGISAVLSGVLQAHRRFVIYALAPVLYNFGIIVGALWLVQVWGVGGLAWGVVLGAFLHMAVQMPFAGALGFSWRPVLELGNVAVRKIAWLSVPRLMGLAVTQINLLVVTVVASKLEAGSLAVFNLASDIQSVPLGLFGISLATAAFPAFSEFVARADFDGLRRSFSSTTRLILFLTVPFAVLLLLLRAQIVRVLLGAGQFDWPDTIATADTLAFFALSLFAQGLLPLLARAHYALKDTRAPLIAGAIGVGLNVALVFGLRETLGIAGLALAFSVSTIVSVAVLWLMLRSKIKSLEEYTIVWSLFKISVAALGMASVVQVMKIWLAKYVDMQTGWGIFTQGAIAGGLGLLVYLLIALALRSVEAHAIKNAFAKKLFRSKEARPIEIVE